ncbi:MAG: hypothetical protein GC199_03825 [Alphaproteobacteria bacterium]|nr:hypothetical protein [Alphaproteobacteria bacterium]
MSRARPRPERALGDSLDGAPMSASALVWLTVAFLASLLAIAGIPAIVPPPHAAAITAEP